ncbi:hypothetical protein MKY98_07970 [Paenibacillus sp. FSL M8-0228]|uniref:hypothetical protein n=1 Tax=Paenibacillus sp. FSL M8-0228 TaxID=2921620 RepID=UPI0030F859D0
MNKFEMKQKLNAWMVKTNEKLEQYSTTRTQLGIDLIDLNLKIGESVATFSIRNMSPSDVEIARKEVGKSYDLDKMLALPSYKMSNVFAALRIYGRKIKAINRKFRVAKEEIVTLQNEIKEMSKAAKEMAQTDFSETLDTLVFQTKDYWDQLKRIVEKPLPGNDVDFMLYIEALFVNGRVINKDDFLQVITLDKNSKYWDGSPKESFASRYIKIPDEIDSEVFKELIFIEKLEHDQDSYLLDIFMNHMFRTMDRYKAETGENMIDTFGILEEITGKPVQTYTAEFDEYGDVVGMTPKKPNLKVVETK